MASPVKDARQEAVAGGYTEIVSRGRNYLVTRNPTTGNVAVDTQVGNRGWHTAGGAEIDTAWVPSVSPWQWQVTNADYNVRAKSLFNGAPLLEYSNPARTEWVTLQPRQLDWHNDRGDVQVAGSVQGVSVETNDDVLHWTGAFGAGRHFEYEAQTARLAKKLILDSYGSLPAPTSQILTGGNPVLRVQFQFAWSATLRVFVDGVQWTGGGGSPTLTTASVIEFRRADDTPAFYFRRPIADDSGTAKISALLRVSRVGANVLVEVRVPQSWLADAARVYPVTIDPTIDETVGAGADDAYLAHDFFFDSGDTEITAGYSSSGPNRVGASARFTTVAVANAATITAATLTVRRQAANVNGEASLRIEAKDEDNAAAPTSIGTFNGTRTTANATWALNMTTSSDYTSSDFASVIQEVVDRAGWASDNAMVIMVEGDADSGGYARIKSYESSSSLCPRLHIEYTEAAGSPKLLALLGVGS